MPTQEERNFALAIYLISFFTVFLGPLVIWLVKKDESDFIDFHGKEYMNFFISYSVYTFVGWILIFVLIGFVILGILGIMALVFTILAAINAYEGKTYRFPFIFRLIK